MLILAIGDLHIPDRAIDLPAKFKKLLSPGKISQVLCLGNLTDKSTQEFLQNVSPDFQLVKGEFDEATALPLSKVVTQGQLRIGVNSGHTIIPNNDPDALLIAARQLDVDIFIWGGTHRPEAYQLEGKFFVNPGTATGAFYSGWPEPEDDQDQGTTDEAEPEADVETNGTKDNAKTPEVVDPFPSFCLLDVQGSVCVIYIYSYIDGEVKVDKISYRKE